MSVGSRDRRHTQQRAKSRALRRLVREHIVELRELYAEELALGPRPRLLVRSVGALDELAIAEAVEMECMLYDLGKRHG